MDNSTGNVTQQFSEYAKDLSSALTQTVLEALAVATSRVEHAYHSGATVFIAGNGGSAGTASHMMADF